MSKFGGAPGLAVHREDEDDELFDTSSSISGDSDGEDQFFDGEEDQGQVHRFAPQPARRMNSDSLYDMSCVMAQLPVKKGLSRYYEGKSQSFACMSEVRCLEDLRKKENPYNRRIKSCRSYVALDESQKAIKKSSCANLMAANNGTGMVYRAPPIHVLNKNGYHQ